jgi:uncharacterized protein (DUF885 family)
MFVTPEVVQQIEIQQNAQTLSSASFEKIPFIDLYCEALIQAGQSNQAEALHAAQAVLYGVPYALPLPWKEQSPVSIEDLFNKLMASEMCRQPQGLSALGLLEPLGLRLHNAYLNDLSIESSRTALEERKALFALMQRYPVEQLTPEQKRTFAVLYWKLAHDCAGEKFLFHEYRVSQTFVGFLSDLIATFIQHHKIEGIEDVDNYLMRLARLPLQLHQTIEVMRYQKEQGIVPPKFALEKVLKILSHYFQPEAVQHPLYLHLEAQLSKAKLCIDDKLEAARLLIEQGVAPQFRLLHAYCQELLESVQTDHGVWALPDGDEWYAYLLRAHTTTNLTPDQVYDMGIQEVARLESEMRALLAAEGVVDDTKTVGRLMHTLANGPEFYYPDTEEGRQECLEDFQRILERTREILWPLFGMTPKIPVSILPVPKNEEEGMPAAYYHPPSIDGTRGGVFYINLHDMEDLCKLRMETLAVHEAEPGHHFQLSLQMQSPIHLLRKVSIFTSYCEGWALYAEKLAYESGFYSTVYQKLGHLQDELLRAVRLVVDTGIHKKRWSKEQAVQYMEEKLGTSHAGIVSEVERYFVAPGQACGYKIGQLKILELRQKAKERLGDKFTLKKFHDTLLACGCVPLDVLEEIVEEYISSEL